MSFSPSTPNFPVFVPNELQIFVAVQRRSLVFYCWFSDKQRLEENKDLRDVFVLIDYSTYNRIIT